jgi:adenylate cyclase class IV
MIEVELKALVNNHNKEALLNALNKDYTFESKEIQLNHYFEFQYSEALIHLRHALTPYLSQEMDKQLETALLSDNLSIRTRQINTDKVLFIVKYSIEDNNSANGNVRKELEVEIDTDLYTLDNLLLSSGLTYASKWSREREIYRNYTNSFNHLVCVDTNAGYGQLVEVETMVSKPEEVPPNKELLYKVLDYLGLDELDSVLLNEMFKFYENNWEKFYGTNKLIWDDPQFINRLIELATN